jgi:quercetin dioxygenase-like cupin family protein
MRIIRFFDTPDGGSRFEEVDIAFPQPYTDEFGYTYHLTKPFNPLNAIIADLPHGLEQDWHVAPNRQLVIVLRGVLEVQTTDSEKRRWSAGGMFLADDPRGKGHQTRVIEGPAQLLFLRVPDDFRVQEWIR